MDATQIKEVWESRAREHGTSPQATTNDFYMRRLEIEFLAKSIERFASERAIRVVADLGCGNGYSTLELAKRFPAVAFIGCDYSERMIESAEARRDEEGVSNVTFKLCDITCDPLPTGCDLVYTDRCLINLPTWDVQGAAILRIKDALVDRGIYVMIENFLEGQRNFERIRTLFDLEPIKMHPYSCYFDHQVLEAFVESPFENLQFQNISSMYYVVSRIVYTKLCQLDGVEPDYFDRHHELASQLPFAGDFGPTGAYYFRKRV